MIGVIYTFSENIEKTNIKEYTKDISKDFFFTSELGKPLISNAKITLSRIEKILYSTPAFINLIKPIIPEDNFQAILTDEQNAKLASGVLELMTKKMVL